MNTLIEERVGATGSVESGGHGLRPQALFNYGNPDEGNVLPGQLAGIAEQSSMDIDRFPTKVPHFVIIDLKSLMRHK